MTKAILGLLGVLLFGCATDAGGNGQECYGNSTCDNGLSCLIVRGPAGLVHVRRCVTLDQIKIDFRSPILKCPESVTP